MRGRIEANTTKIPKLSKDETFINFVGLKDKTAIALIITHINDTFVDYRLEITIFGGASVIKKDRAILYKLPSETQETEDSLTHKTYKWIEFMHFKDKSCKTHIKLGYDKKTERYIFARLYQNCNNHTKDITFENFPILWRK